MMNVLAMNKHGEAFVLMWDDASAAEALEAVRRHALDPQLAFDVEDARHFGARIINRWAEAQAARSKT